jgi:hypothetical protein
MKKITIKGKNNLGGLISMEVQLLSFVRVKSNSLFPSIDQFKEGWSFALLLPLFSP